MADAVVESVNAPPHSSTRGAAFGLEANDVRGALGSVHPGAGKERVIGVRALVAQLEFGVGTRTQPEHERAARALGSRSDLFAAAVLVALGVAMGAEGPQTPIPEADGGIEIEIGRVGPGGPSGGGVQIPPRVVKNGGLSLIDHRSSGRAGTITQGLDTADHHELVGGRGGRVRCCRVHPVRASTMDGGAIEKDGEVALALTADKRLETVSAHSAEVGAGDVTENFGSVSHRYGGTNLVFSDDDQGGDRDHIGGDLEAAVHDGFLGFVVGLGCLLGEGEWTKENQCSRGKIPRKREGSGKHDDSFSARVG